MPRLLARRPDGWPAPPAEVGGLLAQFPAALGVNDPIEMALYRQTVTVVDQHGDTVELHDDSALPDGWTLDDICVALVITDTDPTTEAAWQAAVAAYKPQP